MLKKVLITFFLFLNNFNVNVNATLRSISKKDFFNKQELVFNDNLSFDYKIIANYTLCFTFILILVTTLFYLHKHFLKLFKLALVITLFCTAIIGFNIFEYTTIDKKIDTISNTLVSNLEKNKELEPSKILENYEKNDYGFKFENIKISSDILQDNQTYSLNFKVKYNFLFNILGNFEKYYQFDFKYSNKDSTKIQNTNQIIKPNLKTSSFYQNQMNYNTYCFLENSLDSFDSEYNDEVVILGKNGENYTKYGLKYSPLYSTKDVRMYCSKVKSIEQIYVGSKVNNIWKLTEVK